MIDYNKKILMTGFGVVAQAALPMLLKHLRVPLSNITIIDFADVQEAIKPWIDQGVQFIPERVTPSSLLRLLSTNVGPGDLIIDLAWSINFLDIVSWAHANEVLYVNASLESWGPEYEKQGKPCHDQSLYSRYQKLISQASQWRKGSTAVIDHGANPGLVSHFVKQGLLDIAAKMIHDNPKSNSQILRLKHMIESEDFANIARELAVKVIHCSEWDTQRSFRIKQPDEFVSTWSVEGMWEESISPSELGWGTHEKWLPPNAIKLGNGFIDQLILPQRGLNTWVRSYVPDQEIVGMIVQHGESFSISQALTVYHNKKPVYRPTVHYAYMPCNDSILSLHELRCRNYELHPKKRILTNEITEGRDLIGALIMGHPYKSWWTGSILSIQEARNLVPNVNATAIQVAAGVIAAVLWIINNPNEGLCFPEQLPHDDILKCARPYLGRLLSCPLDWTPLMANNENHGEVPKMYQDQNDPWQFTNFLFRP